MSETTVLKFVSILYRYSQSHMANKLKPYRVGSGQYPFVISVCKNPGINQDGLSERLVMDKGTTAKSVKALISAEYILRHVDRTDRRAYKLYPTEKGKELKLILDAVLAQWQEVLWGGFSEGEKDQAQKLIERMASNAKEFLTKENPRLP